MVFGVDETPVQTEISNKPLIDQEREINEMICLGRNCFNVNLYTWSAAVLAMDVRVGSKFGHIGTNSGLTEPK